MDYEVLYQEIQILEKGFKDKHTGLQKNLKNISKNFEKGDLKTVAKDLAQMQTIIKDQEALLGEMKSTTEQFDGTQYFESGDFAEQMISYCADLGVDVKGEFPVYEMFPYKVKIDVENMDMWVDRKRVQCMRPLSFVKDVKKGLDKLLKANFNAQAFLNELTDAYDLAIIKKNKDTPKSGPDADLFLKDLYQYLAPMQRFRREYDLQNFAFDVARLYSSEIETTKDGRQYQFGPSRKANKLLRILDKDGREQFIATIRFFK